MTGEIINGSCLCGKVRYEFINEHRVFQYCHCSRCRKFTGSSHASNIIVDPEKFTWKAGEEHIGRYEHPDAKHFATTFCKVCGSSLPWLTQSWKAVVIPAGFVGVVTNLFGDQPVSVELSSPAVVEPVTDEAEGGEQVAEVFQVTRPLASPGDFQCT